MKLLVFCSVFALAACYERLHDSLDFTAVAADLGLLRSHVLCYLDKGPCDEDSAQYRTHIQEVWNDACSECNAAQKHQFRIFFFGVKERLPALFDELEKKYDPTGLHLQNDIDTIKNFN